MTSPRLRGVSARVDEETYTALCTRAKTEGLTLSTLVAHLLAASPKTELPAVGTEPQEESSSVTVTGLDRIVNLERWVQLLLSFLIERDPALFQRYDLLCPSCGETELGYVEASAGLEGTSLVRGFVCTQCKWEVTDHAAYAAACCDQDPEPDTPSPAGQTPGPPPSHVSQPAGDER